MPDREKVINGLESCVISMTKCFYNRNEMCPYASVDVCHCEQELMRDALELLKEQEDLGTELTNAVELIHKKNERIEKLLKEQEKLVDVDALRKKLGLAKDCAKCKQNTRACQYDSHFSLMDFCERFDMAIEELMQEGR